MDLSGVDMAREAARRCYTEAGLTSSDVDVLEVIHWAKSDWLQIITNFNFRWCPKIFRGN